MPPRQLRGDPGRVRQILFNLIGNVMKFTLEGEVVVDIAVVQTHTDTTTLRFAITDSGIGLTPESQQTLFESFTQADSSPTRKFGGRRLGLAICKQLVTLMQGEIEVSSQEGHGVLFGLPSPSYIAPPLRPCFSMPRSKDAMSVSSNPMTPYAFSCSTTSNHGE